MSSSARFLLEFQATGDTEVVAALQRISDEAKVTAQSLKELEDIQDPFAEVASGAQSAVPPIEGVGTASKETATTMVDLTSEGEAATTGIEKFGTAAKEAEASTTGLGKSATEITGAITAIGATIGTVVSTMFRYRDAQLAVQTAQSRAAKSSESYRKAEEAIDKVLATATSNTANIAAARDKLSQAQEKLNALQNKGITSGQQYQAAVNEVATAQKELATQAAAGGVDIAKLTDAMNKSANASAASATSNNRLEKAIQNQQRTVLDSVFGWASLGGNIAQIVPKLGNAGKAFSGISKVIGGLVPLIGAKLGGALGTLSLNLGGIVSAVGLAYAAFQVFELLPNFIQQIAAAVKGDIITMTQNAVEGLKKVQELGKFLPAGHLTLLDPVLKEMEKYLEKIGGVTEETKKAAPAFFDLNGRLQEGITEWNNTINALSGVEGAQAKMTNQTSRFTNSARLGTAATAEMSGATAEMSGTMGELTTATGEGINLQSRFADSVRLLGPAYESAGDRITENINKIKEAQGTMGDFIVDVTGQITEGNQQFFESQVANNEELNKGRDILSGFSDSMDDTINSVKNARDALGDHTQELQNQIASLQDVESQEIRQQNALLEVTAAYEESNQAVRNSNAILQSEKAVRESVMTAINEEIVALNEEAIALAERNAIAADTEIQQQRLVQAYEEGIVSVNEFIAALDEEAQKQKAYESGLRGVIVATREFGDATTYSAEQLEHFAGVMAAVPADLDQLANDIGKLAQEATKFVEFAGEEDELFGNWKISDKVPDEIKDMMTDADRAFIEGRAQLERNVEFLGPLFGVRAATAIQQGSEAAFDSLRDFGTEAAGIIRATGDQLDPAAEELAKSFEAIGTASDAEMIPAMARAVTALENVNDPAAALRQQMAQLAIDTGLGVEPLAQLSGGLDALRGAAASAGQPLKDIQLSLAEMNTVTIKETGQKFGEINGQLVELKPAASGAGTALAGLGVDATDAHTKLTALHTILTLIPQIKVAPTVDVDTTAAHGKLTAMHQALTALTQIKVAPVISADTTQAITAFNAASRAALILRNNVVAATTGIKSAVGTAGAAASAFASKATSAFNTTSRSALTARNNVNQMSSGMRSALNSAASAASRFSSSFSSAMNRVRSQASSATSAVNRLRSSINSLKSKSINIHVGLSGPGVRYLQHGFHGVVDKPMLFVAGEAGPERVDVTPGRGGPLGRGGNEIIHRTVSVGAAGGGGRPINITVIGELNGKELIRFTRRGIMEDAAGMM